jgi:hypothetical protein
MVSESCGGGKKGESGNELPHSKMLRVHSGIGALEVLELLLGYFFIANGGTRALILPDQILSDILRGAAFAGPWRTTCPISSSHVHSRIG